MYLLHTHWRCDFSARRPGSGYPEVMVETLPSPAAPSAVWVAAEALLGALVGDPPRAFSSAHGAGSIVSSVVFPGLKLLTQVRLQVHFTQVPKAIIKPFT